MIGRRSLLAAALLAQAGPVCAGPTPRWLTLPPTPALPATARSGLAGVNGIKVWHAVFGDGEPVVMLHGGLANADYWGLQVPELARHHQVIVMDSRGHGRSTRDGRPYGYDLMADDVVALLDHLGVGRAAVVGWSDGAIIGLDLALRHPGRVSRVFAFAANTDPGGVMPHVGKNPTFAAYIERAGQEYARLSPRPGDYGAFVKAISRMWATQPNWTAAQLGRITVPVLVTDGDHDEAIKRAHTELIAARIPGAGLLIQPNVSHFAFLQDPAGFTGDVLRFLGESM
jgi:pimeloyl-ACP methyl ester carboxylesterase